MASAVLTHRGTATNVRLHCFVRLIYLPLRSILRLRPSFFPERGRSRSPEVHWTAGTLRVFEAFSWLWEVFLFRALFSPAAGNASCWAAH